MTTTEIVLNARVQHRASGLKGTVFSIDDFEREAGQERVYIRADITRQSFSYFAYELDVIPG